MNMSLFKNVDEVWIVKLHRGICWFIEFNFSD
jgi:hypothetical protein